ncbi:PEP-CTERM sorting domain-containing protein [Janthinobacterium fluminis]|uniref:PEP-CTERM sorting domain-containing protein n=1 Tax=Janthinobacterium fluminis TaxID=2987524 RepID=A0ABT5K1R0_9BURK|nr:PEP-CTERM sorting domain-containing protein [Janthinobacterium fluminis]MDC8758610.1 PEP-CTERM sorting domain-containing protein [Janthinobacterium fluminis]
MKQNFSLRSLAAASLLVCAAAAPAYAAVIDFDDIVVPPTSNHMDTTVLDYAYQGFTWSGGAGGYSWLVSPAAAAPYLSFPGVATHSGPNFAWTNGSSDVSLSASHTFNVDSFWARDLSGTDQAVAHGYLNGVEIFTRTLRMADTYQQFNLHFNGIDTLTLTNHGNLLIDDISISAVPEPTSYAMLLGGLALLGGIARRRKGAAAQ